MKRWYCLAALVLLLDRLSKYWVTENYALGDQSVIWPVFSLVRWHNKGAAFSFLNDAGGWQTGVFIILAIAFAAFIIREIFLLKRNEHFSGFIYAMVLGGALGNLWGRIAEGYVVDFILLHYQSYYFPAFNLADSALFVGACGWIVLIYQDYKSESAIQNDGAGNG
jgi:signal peptidase II